MPRPTKSARVLTDYSQTKAEISARIEAEEKLKGSDDRIISPKHLNANQKEIFSFIVDELRGSAILGNVDVHILGVCAIAIDRMQAIETMINENPDLLLDKALLSSKKEYTQEFFKAASELSLSPSSRAKIGNINIQAKQKEEDPLLKVLKFNSKNERR